MSAIIPVPRHPITTRLATLSDLPFIDSLQKMHTKMVGWMPMKQLEGKISAGHVLIAEEPSPLPSPRVLGEGERVGYVIGRDQYFKRDDVGIIYQMNVVPGRQRGLIGAAMLKAQFERSAWGCKLYCCWCAQDIAANHFWEAMGFVPLAFRAGSETKRRVHIFWAKRIRQGDTGTPWWFPSQTTGGSMMEDRLVFPIPPGTHWSDAKPIVLPKDTHRGEAQPRQIEDQSAQRITRKIKPALPSAAKRQPLCGGLTFAAPEPAIVKVEKPKQRKEKIRNNPEFVAAARELRDRWLEEVNAGRYLPVSAGKYEVGRQIETKDTDQPRLLIEHRAAA